MKSSLAVFIDPPSHHFLGDRLFDPGTARLGGENLLAPHIAVRDRLAERGIAVHTLDGLVRHRAERNLVISLGRTEGAEQVAGDPSVVRSAFIAMECPIVEPSIYRALPRMARLYRRIYSWTGGPELLPFTRTPVEPTRFWWPQSFDAVRDDLWGRTERGFLAMVNANKLPRLYDRELYTQRLHAVAYFHQFGEIALFGKAWHGMPMRVGRTWVPATLRRLQGKLWPYWQRVRPNPLYVAAAAATHGPVDSKLEALSRYQFALCFENMVLRGWMTEKLFDCLCAGTVPVYWGATDVEEWVDPACFIDMRSLGTFEELRRFLKAVSPEQLTRYREAGRDFLASRRFDRFRIAAWVERIERIVQEDGGLAS
jgi:hypothetical protein